MKSRREVGTIPGPGEEAGAWPGEEAGGRPGGGQGAGQGRRQGPGHGQEFQRQDWGQDRDKMTCVMLDVKTRACQHSHFLFCISFVLICLTHPSIDLMTDRACSKLLSLSK